MIRRAAFLLLLLPACSWADEYADAVKGQPTDVARQIERIIDCNHWAGEEPYDKARQQEILQAIAKLRCEQLPQDEKKLKKRYGAQSPEAKAINAARDTFD